MKTLITLISLLFVSLIHAQQYFNFAQSATNNRQEWHFQNSPTNMDANRIVVGFIKGQQSSPGVALWSTFVMQTDTIRFPKLAGSGVSVIGLNANGSIYRLNKYALIDTTVLATKSWVNGILPNVSGKLNISDTAAMLNNYALLSDIKWSNLSGIPSAFMPMAHMHGIAEILSLSDSLSVIDSLIGIKEPAFSKNTAFNKNFGTASGTIAEGNDSRILNGQTAFGWGNHAAAGYAKIADTIGGPGNGKIMTTAAANNAINTLTNDVNGKVPASRTITINGVTQDLSANRTFTISAGTGTVTSVGVTNTSDITATGSPVTTSGNISLNLSTTGVTAGRYDWVQVDTKGRVTAAGNPSLPTPIAPGTRSFNTGYQVSTTLYSSVTVGASCSVSLGVLGSGNGTATVEISANGTTGWISLGLITKNSANLVGLTTANGGSFTFTLPPGYYYRMVTASSTTGIGNTVSFTFEGGSFVTF